MDAEKSKHFHSWWHKNGVHPRRVASGNLWQKPGFPQPNICSTPCQCEEFPWIHQTWHHVMNIPQSQWSLSKALTQYPLRHQAPIGNQDRPSVEIPPTTGRRRTHFGQRGWKILVSWDDYSQYMEKKMFQTTNQILSFWSWWQISWYPHFWLIQPTSNATPPPEGPAAGRPKQVPCKPEPCRAFSKPLAVNGQQACHSSVRWWRVQRNRCFFSRGFRYL